MSIGNNGNTTSNGIFSFNPTSGTIIGGGSIAIAAGNGSGLQVTVGLFGNNTYSGGTS